MHASYNPIHSSSHTSPSVLWALGFVSTSIISYLGLPSPTAQLFGMVHTFMVCIPGASKLKSQILITVPHIICLCFLVICPKVNATIPSSHDLLICNSSKQSSPPIHLYPWPPVSPKLPLCWEFNRRGTRLRPLVIMDKRRITLVKCKPWTYTLTNKDTNLLKGK